MLPETKLARVHELWDELADFPVSQVDAALLHLMKPVCGWLHANDAVWVGSVRMVSGAAARHDGQFGWRMRAYRRLDSTPARMLGAHQAAKTRDSDPSMTSRALAAEAGRFRVYRLRDGFVDCEAFRRTTHYKAVYRDRGVDDRMCVVFPVNADAESYFLFDHVDSRRRFSIADAQLAGYALRGIKWFHRQLLLSHNLLLANVPIQPAQRRVLLMLLTGRSEKEIAAALGLAAGTTHQYAVELYRSFGVKGRTGLMEMWLGR
jgi:DNA-binding CsgD family transcriptional regulator